MQKIYLFMFAILLISSASAQTDLGVFANDQCIELIQTCDSCTYNNVSRVVFPNGTLAIESETDMSEDGIYYNLTFCKTETLGEYYVYGHGDLNTVDTVWAYTFDITGNGQELTNSKAIVYLAMFGVLIFFFIGTFFGIGMLPNSDMQDEEGQILQISYLKYFRPVGWLFEYFFLMAIMFLASNLGYAYMGETLFAEIFFNIYTIMMSLALPIIIIWISWILLKIIKDQKLKKMIERGFFPQGKL